MVGRTGIILGDLTFAFLDYQSYVLWRDSPQASRGAIQDRLRESGQMVWPRENDPVVVTDSRGEVLQVQQPTGRRIWIPAASVQLN